MLIGLTTDLAGCDKKEDRASRSEEPRYEERRAADASPAVAAGERYAEIAENQVVSTADAAISTFAIDVDTASYSNIRRFLNDGVQPPADAVRIEELVNYFNYDYPSPTGEVPFSVTSEIADCPWNSEARLVHIGLQARDLASDQVPARNLVFLLDVSGSMESPDKLPLLRRAMKLMVEGLDADDRVAIVVYAGAAGVVLDPTSGADQQSIMAALDRLQAGGSTNGGAGIERAYALARENFKPGAINRVILATDGDFNVGTTSQSDLERLIERERESGVFLSVLGLGTGNLQDSTMEMLADKGNGNYAYLDSIAEARKVLVEEAGGTLVTVAKDVKIQVEFDPKRVASYRLIGYENRLLDQRDFEDDRKDAGEIGAGHSVTAMYEIVLADQAVPSEPVAELRLRYKQPSGDQSELITFPIVDPGTKLADSSSDFRFAAAVAEFGMLLRESPNRGSASWANAKALAEGALGQDRGGHRQEFLELLGKAERLD
ncbi:MAG TPA: VWA domain-containing protein [Enhygromyxa sp.]|nr:VWA domain-containing protein [Enhygromyxa sp.]